MTATTNTSDRPAALEVEGVRFQYPGAEGFGLEMGSLVLAAGEQVLLTGGSGTGKSTLLQIVAGLLDPQSGRVCVAGRDVHAMPGPARDRFRGSQIGMIFQTFNLLQGFSALENVMAALMFSTLPRAEYDARARGLLGSLGIARVTSRVENLSVGQQQRVAVARAVACRPALVLADEPTASLDPENARAAIELIQQTCRENGAALLCTSHDPSMRERFARVQALAAPGSGVLAGAGEGGAA